MRSVVAAALALAACRPAPPAQAPTAAPAVAPQPSPQPSPPPLACPTGELVRDFEPRPECAGRGPACVIGCRAGDRQACYWLAQATLADPATRDDAQALFHRACELGHASGCTNYGAGLVVSGIEPDCATRLFERACSVDDHHGCGMVAHMMLAGAQPPDDATRARARAHLEASCERIGGVPCYLLSVLVERGTLGAPDPVQAQALRKRACDTGDIAACEPAPAPADAAAP